MQGEELEGGVLGGVEDGDEAVDGGGVGEEVVLRLLGALAQRTLEREELVAVLEL